MKKRKVLCKLFFTILLATINVLSANIIIEDHLISSHYNKFLSSPYTNDISSKDDKENLKNSLTNFITKTYNTRNNIVTSGNIEGLKKYFNLNALGGKNCFENEVCRMMYLRDWSSERGLTFASIESFPTITSIKIEANVLRLQIDEDYKFKYIYDDDSSENVFGVSLNHYIKLKKQNDSYIIITDYYLDCFSDALKGYYHNINNNVLPQANTQIYRISDFICKERELKIPNKKWQYNRLKAVQYADRYCGVRWVNNNISPKFNTKYTNYTGVGGNCTNFVSQCIGDEDGANLPQNNGWHTQKHLNNTYACSAAWVNADAFRNYIVYSSKGYLLKRGSFASVVSTSNSLPNSIFEKLTYGDLISYEKKGDIDHNSIICEFDSHGYPMINSNTVERYHVPFDLGWGNNNIAFHLLHLN